MKNYDETINSVFERINEYEVEKKHKRKIITRTVTSLCCFCLVALLGIGVWQSDLFKSMPPTVVDGSSNIGELDDSSLQATDNGNGDKQNQSQQDTSVPIGVEGDAPTTDDKTENDNVRHICYLNQIDGIANAAPLYLDPAKHYTEDWNNEKVTQYLGIDLRNLGSEFEYIGEQNHTVTYRNDGTLVRDLMGFSYKYSGSEFTVAVSKLSLPYDCIYALEESKKTNVGTEKGSVEVLFAGAAGGENATENQTLIVADFELNGVNYRVKAENISLTSFYNFVRSILNK